MFHPGRDMWVAVRVDRGEPAEEEEADTSTSWVWEVRQYGEVKRPVSDV